MVKLTLKQIDSLIDNDELEEKQLKECLKDGYNEKELEEYFLTKLEENKNTEDDEYDGTGEEPDIYGTENEQD